MKAIADATAEGQKMVAEAKAATKGSAASAGPAAAPAKAKTPEEIKAEADKYLDVTPAASSGAQLDGQLKALVR